MLISYQPSDRYATRAKVLNHVYMLAALGEAKRMPGYNAAGPKKGVSKVPISCRAARVMPEVAKLEVLVILRLADAQVRGPDDMIAGEVVLSSRSI